MMLSKKLIVAIDGPAGSGKSSVSKDVAVQLGLKYIDSGALYRSVTWFFLDKFGKVTENLDFFQYLSNLNIVQDFQSDGNIKTYVNEKDVSQLIRDEIITKNIGIISDNRKVRDFVNNLLRKWGEKESIIMDGRDIGSVVFPHADLKIYLDASVDIRTERRVKEYIKMGKNVDEIAIKNQIILRDKQDKSRPFGALVKAEDAIYIDTSKMNQDNVVEHIKDLILHLDSSK